MVWQEGSISKQKGKREGMKNCEDVKPWMKILALSNLFQVDARSRDNISNIGKW